MKIIEGLSLIKAADCTPDYLAKFDDTVYGVLPVAGDSGYVSLCKVFDHSNGKQRLYRFADIDTSGRLNVFKANREYDFIYGNRDMLFFSDGPNKSNQFGIWNWNAIPDPNDPEKDFITSKYNAKLIPIEIIIIPEASSATEIISMLKTGYCCNPICEKTMFTAKRNSGHCVGVLCGKENMASKDGKIAFSDKATFVPIYEFDSSFILRLDNNKSFYKNIFAGIPSQIYQVKSDMEIVKGIVLNTISWKKYKEKGSIRADYLRLKNCLNMLPTDDISEKICEEFHCDLNRAYTLMNQFVASASEYIGGESIDDEIIVSAIISNSTLMSRAKELVSAEWETENRNHISLARADLDAVKAQLSDASKKLAEIQSKIDELKEEKTGLEGEIAGKQRLVLEVETEVANRINNAKERAAEFIAEMAFVGNNTSQLSDQANTSLAAETYEYYLVAENEVHSDMEAHKNWNDVIETASVELKDAGVSNAHSRALSAFLCAAYIKKQPVLLAGPNADEIVEAFAAALLGHKRGVLHCGKEYSPDVLKRTGENNEEIICVTNLFSGNWITHLQELFSSSDSLYIVTHPFPEDIQVEPKSLFNMMLPVFTDFLVNKEASGNYIGGFFDNDFKEYDASRKPTKELRALSCVKVSPYYKNKVTSLLAVMHDLYPDMSYDDDFLLCVLPIAFATMSVEQLTSKLESTGELDKISRDVRKELQFVLGEP